MCGICATIATEGDSAENGRTILDTAKMMQFMVNRGRHSFGLGIIGTNGQKNDLCKFLGSVSEKMTDALIRELIDEHPGPRSIVIGHVRYPTASKNTKNEAQPHYAGREGRRFVIVSNGDLPFCAKEISSLKELDAKFDSSCDAEVIVKWIAHEWSQNEYNEEDAFTKVCSRLKGAYSFACITPSGRLFVVRDEIGFHPLFYAKDAQTSMIYVCSESGALEKMTLAKPIEVKNGEILIIDPNGATTQQILKHRFSPEKPACPCAMEVVYFCRPDSKISDNDQLTNSGFRFLLGGEAAEEWIAKGYPIPDCVCSIPHSGDLAGSGFAFFLSKLTKSIVPFIPLIVKDISYRIFMEMESEVTRRETAKERLTILRDFISGILGLGIKHLAIVDDTVVRGDQSGAAIENIKAIKDIVDSLNRSITISLIFTLPPHRNACRYGLNTPDKHKLIGYDRTDDEVREILNADYVHYLTLEGFREVYGRRCCTACVDGNYLTPIPEDGKEEI